MITETAERGFGHWAVIERATQCLVGNCGFRSGDSAGELEIGFTIARSRWNRGYATEIAGACMQHGFSHLHASRIRSLTMPNNIAARRVLEKLGMRQIESEQHDEIEWCVHLADGSSMR